MLKQDITYEDFDGNEVTETFYFSYTKLEMLEKDLELGGVEEAIKRLEKTQDAQEAYAIFKKVVLDTVGKKSDDGRRFVKTPEIRADFENSPALSELIIGFLQDPIKGAEFMNGVLPASVVTEVKNSATTPPAVAPAATPTKATDVDYEALLAEMPSDDTPKEKITKRQAEWMKQRLNEQQFENFMSTRVIVD